MMVASMKAISVAIDAVELETPVNFLEYTGYMLCSATSLFGPWISFESYNNLYKKTTWVCSIYFHISICQNSVNKMYTN